jgi:hypothetical protein
MHTSFSELGQHLKPRSQHCSCLPPVVNEKPHIGKTAMKEPKNSQAENLNHRAEHRNQFQKNLDTRATSVYKCRVRGLRITMISGLQFSAVRFFGWWYYFTPEEDERASL